MRSHSNRGWQLVAAACLLPRHSRSAQKITLIIIPTRSGSHGRCSWRRKAAITRSTGSTWIL